MQSKHSTAVVLPIVLCAVLFTIFARADDTQTVFLSGDTWTCFGDDFECAGFAGGNVAGAMSSFGVLLSAPSGKSVSVTQNATYLFVVRNIGNTPDTFALSLSGGATASLNQTSVSLNPDDNATIMVTVSSAAAGNYTTALQAVSNANPSISSQASVVTAFIAGPAIVGTTLQPQYAVAGANITLGLTAVNAVNASATVVAPNGTATQLSLTPGVNATFSKTAAVGVYNVTFNVTDAFNATASAIAFFQVFPPATFSLDVVDANQTGLTTTVTFIYNSTVLHTDNTTNGTYADTTLASIIDIGIEAYNTSVTLRGINATAESGKSFGIDKPQLSGYVTAYAFQNNYTFTNASVTIGYAGAGYADERYLKLYVCHDYNFTNRTCNTAFEPLAGTQSFVDKSFTAVVTGFSAFAIKQEVPQATAKPTTSVAGGCAYRIDCADWPTTCENGLMSRSCTYTAICDGTKWVYKELRACSVSEQPIPVAPFQMAGFLDLDKSEIPVGGAVQARVNVETPAEDALVTFVYQIDGQEVIQDTSEQRLVNRSDSFYTNISTGKLPPGVYNLTIKARYAGEQAVLKEQFTLIAERKTELSINTSANTTLSAEQQAQQQTQHAGQPAEERPTSINVAGFLAEIGKALSTIGNIIATPLRALYHGLLAVSGTMLVLLIIALLMPPAYLAVRTHKVRLPKIPLPKMPHIASVKVTTAPAKPQTASQTTPSSPPLADQQASQETPASAPVSTPITTATTTVTPTETPAASTTASATPVTVPVAIPTAAPTVDEKSIAAIKSRAASIKQITDYRVAMPAYQALHDDYNSLPDDAKQAVYQDILLAQEHLEQAYFDQALTSLDLLTTADTAMAVNVYEQLSQHADRMTIAQYQRLIETSKRLAEKAGIKNDTDTNSAGTKSP